MLNYFERLNLLTSKAQKVFKSSGPRLRTSIQFISETGRIQHLDKENTASSCTGMNQWKNWKIRKAFEVWGKFASSQDHIEYLWLIK